jgi:hypothetical protein
MVKCSPKGQQIRMNWFHVDVGSLSTAVCPRDSFDCHKIKFGILPVCDNHGRSCVQLYERLMVMIWVPLLYQIP